MQKVRRLIEAHGLAKKVQLLGHLGRARLLEELAKTSIMLLPSRQENAPMAISEAMAAAVPVIASNRCGMPYMVADGKTGFLIEPEDCDQIAAKLSLIMREHALRQHMGVTARESALERFHPRQVALRTLDVYRHVAQVDEYQEVTA